MGNRNSTQISGNDAQRCSLGSKKKKGEDPKRVLRRLAESQMVTQNVPEVEYADDGTEDCWEEGLNEATFEQTSKVRILTETDHVASVTEPKDYIFPFENLVFPGIPISHGQAFVGALEALDCTGVLKQIKRVGGSGTGAIFAALVGLGYTPKEIGTFLVKDLINILTEHPWSYTSMLPNMLRSFGWNPGQKLVTWLGERLKGKDLAENVTFRELYEAIGVELCVVVYNVNRHAVELWHPKTKPDVAVRDALRMAITTPCLWTALGQKIIGVQDIYVGADSFHRYPINMFDGCYLSMDPADRFLLKMPTLQKVPTQKDILTTSGGLNCKTIGIVLGDEQSPEMTQTGLTDRQGFKSMGPEEVVTTSLSMVQETRKRERFQFALQHSQMAKAFDALLKRMAATGISEDQKVDRSYFLTTLCDSSAFPRRYFKALMGSENKFTRLMDLMDVDGDGQIVLSDLLDFIEAKNLSLQACYQNLERRPVGNFADFLTVVNCKSGQSIVQERDIGRTVGVHTGHLGPVDFRLEDGDRDFLQKRGFSATNAYLRYFVVQQPDFVKLAPEDVPMPEGPPPEGEADVKEGAEVDGGAEAAEPTAANEEQSTLLPATNTVEP